MGDGDRKLGDTFVVRIMVARLEAKLVSIGFLTRVFSGAMTPLFGGWLGAMV